MSLISIQIDAAGFNFGDAAKIIVNGTVVDPGLYGRGLNVAVLDQSSGALLSFQTYDTCQSPAAADAFAAAVEALPVGRLVLVAVKDEAQDNLTNRAKLACQSLGSISIFDLAYRGSWALIGQKGASPGTRIEALSNTSAVSIAEEFEGQPISQGGFALNAVSAGFTFGDSAAISINQQLVSVQGGYGRGLNVVVVDENTAEVLASGTYDTYESVEASNQFAALLENLPPGRIAIVAVRGEAVRNLTDRAKAACESLGSAQIRNLASGGSWSLIGVKNALIGGVCETLSNGSKACACSWLQPPTNRDTYFNVSAMSAGYDCGNTAALTIDDIGVLTTPAASRGFNVVVISPDTGVATAKGSFDTNGDSGAADRLAAFIDNVPAGWLVVAAVCDEAAQRLNENARRALRSVGSALIGNLGYRNSYAIFGCKGGAPGSVPEMLRSDSAVSVSYRYPLTAVRESGFVDVRVYSAGWRVGDAATITIDGTVMDMPGGYSRGLNVALLDRYGLVQSAEVFDTHECPDASDAFAALIEGAPNGQVVAIAVKDEAQLNLTVRAKLACKSIGSTLIDQLGYRGSWAIVGAKGRAPGTAAEMLSNTAPAFAASWVMSRQESAQGFWLGAQSAGYKLGNVATILLNGNPVQFIGGTSRGLNVAVFDEATGTLLSASNYDTYESPKAADDFATMIESLPLAKIVAIAVKDEATLSLTDRTRRACGLIGSSKINTLGYRGSWVLIGMKGATPGSALELVENNAPAGVQMWMGFFTVDKARAAAMPMIGWLAAFLVGAVICAVAEILVGIMMILPESDSTPPPPLKRTRRRGVFVGIDYSKNIPGLRNLRGLGSQIMGELYRRATNLGYFDSAETLLLIESQAPPDIPSKQKVVQALQWLLQDAKDGDVLYFHFIGHGGKNTTVNPPYEYLITLDDSLSKRDVLREKELQAMFADLSKKVNLTCVFHCCFSGDMIDHSDNGRGIAIASTAETTPDTLLIKGANLTGAIGAKLKSVSKGQVPMPTYIQLREFINGQMTVNNAIVIANSLFYDVNSLVFIDPLPVTAEAKAKPM